MTATVKAIVNVSVKAIANVSVEAIANVTVIVNLTAIMNVIMTNGSDKQLKKFTGGLKEGCRKCSWRDRDPEDFEVYEKYEKYRI